MKGIFVTGTGTSVGKTWVGKHLVSTLCRNGIDVLPRKPVESGWSDDITQTDAWLLANAANKVDEINIICPNQFKSPVSPVRAAAIEGKELFLDTLQMQCITDYKNKQFLYVEGAGGFYSPLCTDGLNADLASALNLPILLVVDNRLGCINHALLNAEAIYNRKLNLQAVVLNNSVHPDEANKDMDNLTDLNNALDCPVIAVEYGQTCKVTFEKLSTIITNASLN